MAVAIATVHHNRGLTSTALHLLLHVRAVLDVLPEIANVTADLLVGFERERDDGDEAEGEPFPEVGVLVDGVEVLGVGGCVGLCVSVREWAGTYHRFITRPEKLPQFWHCTVMCSAPESADWKARWC